MKYQLIEKTKAHRVQYTINFGQKIVIDFFAGGGGASTGLEVGLDQPIYAAVNHNPIALSMHEANHPTTIHHTQDVYAVDMVEITGGYPVGWFHASPDCTHHSQAAGGQPRKKEIRDLGWVIPKAAGKLHPDVISMENVKQMLQWGPLIAKRCKVTGRVVTLDVIKVGNTKSYRVAEPGEYVPRHNQFLVPDPKRKGQTWRQFVAHLQRLGYVVEWKILNAADYGAPTKRERLFVIARCDGEPIVWPEPTHAKKPNKKQKPWKPIADCLDFTDLGKSIFERAKPYADATCRRVAKGLKRFVIDNPNPYIVTNTTGHNGGPVTEPVSTITSAGNQLLVNPVLAPYLAGVGGPKYSAKPTAIDQPFGTQCASNHKAIVTPVLAPFIGRDFSHGVGHPVSDPTATTTAGGGGHSTLVTGILAPFIGRDFRTGFAHAVTEPGATTTATAGGGHSRLVTARLVPFITECANASTERNLPVNEPAPVICAKVKGGHLAVVSPLLISVAHGDQGISQDRSCPLHKPLPTILGKGKYALVAPVMIHAGHGEGTPGKPRWSAGSNSVEEPVGAITASNGGHSMASAFMVQANGGFNETPGHPVTEPCSTITNSGSQQQLATVELSKDNLEGALRVAAFLINYYGNGDARDITEPADTLTTKDRLALVTVYIKGDPFVIVDIRLRMLKPRELYRAQGFPDSYIIDRGHDGKPLTIKDQVFMCGNSVSPPPMAAIAQANSPYRLNRRAAA